VLMDDNFDSDESWEPSEHHGRSLDFGYDTSCSDDADAPYVHCKTETLDIDASQNQKRVQICNSDSTRTAASDPSSCDVEGYGETNISTQVYSDPPKHSTSTTVDLPGNKKRKQGMHGNQAS
jgi:hypothetical protein